MRPVFSHDDEPDRASIHSVFVCKFILGHAAGCISFADAFHILGFQFGSSVALSRRITTFGMAVAVVIAFSAKKVVRWIDAQTDVTAVENAQTLWDGAIDECVGHSVCAKIAATVVKRPISTTIGNVCPKPTFVGFASLVLSAKAFNRRFIHGSSFPWAMSRVLGGTPGRFTMAQGMA